MPPGGGGNGGSFIKRLEATWGRFESPASEDVAGLSGELEPLGSFDFGLIVPVFSSPDEGRLLKTGVLFFRLFFKLLRPFELVVILTSISDILSRDFNSSKEYESISEMAKYISSNVIFVTTFISRKFFFHFFRTK